MQRDKKLIRELTDGLIASGLLGGTIEERIQARADQYIDDNSAEIAAKMRERTREIQLQVEELDRRKLALEADLDAKERQAAIRIEQERASFEAEAQVQRANLNREEQELEARREEFSEYLETVTERFQSSRGELIKDFIALIPLLRKTNALGPDGSMEASPKPDARQDQPQFSFPTFVSNGQGYVPVTERDFFERFCAHVQDRGFRYRQIDLVSFHLNFKTSEFFVLGGVSGTGKSSLPRLYAEALAGDDLPAQERFLRIAVNPTWLEVNDVLGRVNVLDRTFNPSETGLFRHLVYAQREFETKRLESGLWPIILDEMNLAQVEHYFGPFLQVFGLEEIRTIQIFDPAVVNKSDCFAQWAKLVLPRSLRFIGTVNFDETTKQLSLRLLDRGPLARIDVAPPAASENARKASGASILVRHLQEWNTNSEINRNGLQLLDEINPQLKLLGCPLNPRRKNAIEMFLTNTDPSICDSEIAVDLAISQRILPLVRGLFRQPARDAFDKLEKSILDATIELPECERVLGEIRDREYNLLLAH
jgi:hypothetical protein